MDLGSLSLSLNSQGTITFPGTVTGSVEPNGSVSFQVTVERDPRQTFTGLVTIRDVQTQQILIQGPMNFIFGSCDPVFFQTNEVPQPDPSILSIENITNDD